LDLIEDPNIKGSRLLRQPDHADSDEKDPQHVTFDHAQDDKMHKGLENYKGITFHGATPVTQNTHILLQYQPYVKKRQQFHILRMDNMEFCHKHRLLDLNKDHPEYKKHYHPSFIAQSIDQLREQKDTRKKLREYNVCDDGQEDVDSDQETEEKSDKKKTSVAGMSRQSTKNLDAKSKRSDGQKSDKSLDKSLTRSPLGQSELKTVFEERGPEIQLQKPLMPIANVAQQMVKNKVIPRTSSEEKAAK